jgi:peptide/nickel transport system permease protein
MAATRSGALEAATARRVSWSTRARRLPRSMRIAAIPLGFYILVAITGPYWAPHSPTENSGPPFAPASWAHPFGTDVLARDVFSRVVDGTRDVLFLSLTSTAAAVIVGGFIGLASGYVGGWVDHLIMRASETIISVPLLILALLIIVAAGPEKSGSRALLIGVVGFVYLPRIARMARTVAVDLVTRDFVIAARARGESVWSITRRELLPNATGVLLVEFGVRAGYAPILVSSLAFLGFGSRPPSPEWGLMISENRVALGSAPLSVLAPAGALALLVVSLNVFTEGFARYLGRTAVRTP